MALEVVVPLEWNELTFFFYDKPDFSNVQESSIVNNTCLVYLIRLKMMNRCPVFGIRVSADGVDVSNNALAFLSLFNLEDFIIRA